MQSKYEDSAKRVDKEEKHLRQYLAILEKSNLLERELEKIREKSDSLQEKLMME